jgi:hypothetical protein
VCPVVSEEDDSAINMDYLENPKSQFYSDLFLLYHFGQGRIYEMPFQKTNKPQKLWDEINLHTFYKIYFQKKNLVINGPIYRISDDFCS